MTQFIMYGDSRPEEKMPPGVRQVPGDCFGWLLVASGGF